MDKTRSRGRFGIFKVTRKFCILKKADGEKNMSRAKLDSCGDVLCTRRRGEWLDSSGVRAELELEASLGRPRTTEDRVSFKY